MHTINYFSCVLMH